VSASAPEDQETPVKLVNTDGMALFGPGSEWLWTAVSGVVLAVTFLAIYRQLRMQRSAAAIEQLERIERELTSERIMRCRLAVLRAQRAGVDAADLPEHAAAPIVNFWERVGSLARRGHLDLELLWDGGSAFYCQSDWVRLGPSIVKSRIEDGNPAVAEHFEWLVREVEARARRTGVRLADAEQQAAHLSDSIAGLEFFIGAEEALRRVFVAPEPAPGHPAVPVTPTASIAAES
jgi:hypothetical protein